MTIKIMYFSFQTENISYCLRYLSLIFICFIKQSKQRLHLKFEDKKFEKIPCTCICDAVIDWIHSSDHMLLGSIVGSHIWASVQLNPHCDISVPCHWYNTNYLCDYWVMEGIVDDAVVVRVTFEFYWLTVQGVLNERVDGGISVFKTVFFYPGCTSNALLPVWQCH